MKPAHSGLPLWLGHLGELSNEHSVCQRFRRLGFNPRSSHTKNSKKWYLMLPCLALSIIR